MEKNDQNAIFQFIQFNETIRSRFLNITSPIREILDIHFHCTRIYHDGHYCDLGHEIDFLKKSYMNDLMSQGSFFLNELCAFKSSDNYISLWPPLPTDPYLNWLYDSNIWQGFEIYEKHDSYIQIWTFITTRDRGNLTNFYLNNLNLLKEFIFYFKDKGGQLLDTLPRKYLPFSETYRQFFLQPNDEVNLVSETFKNEIKVKHYNLTYKQKNFIISKREAECLMYLSSGKTAKESARLLHLSPRTVEAYLQNLKMKFHCDSKSHLVDIFLETSLKPEIIK